MPMEMVKLAKWEMKTAGSEKTKVFSHHHPLGSGSALAHVSAISLQTPRAELMSCSSLMKHLVSW